MKPEGWIFMISSLTFVLGLVIYCFYHVLRKPSSANRMHSPVDIDTRDIDT